MNIDDLYAFHFWHCDHVREWRPGNEEVVRRQRQFMREDPNYTVICPECGRHMVVKKLVPVTPHKITGL